MNDFKRLLSATLAATMLVSTAPYALALEGAEKENTPAVSAETETTPTADQPTTPEAKQVAFDSTLKILAETGAENVEDATVSNGKATLTGTVDPSKYTVAKTIADEFGTKIFNENGTLVTGKEYAVFGVKFTDLEDGAHYVVEQENPSLTEYKGDSNIKGITKTDNYSKADLEAGLNFLANNEKGEITIKIAKVEGADITDLPTEGVVTLTITNNLEFTKEEEQTKVTATLNNLDTEAITVKDLTVTGSIDLTTYKVTDTTAKADFETVLDKDGAPLDGKKFALAKIAFADLKDTEYYTVRQTNKGMNAVYGADSFKDDQKVKSYLGSDLKSGLNFILADGKLPVKFEVQLGEKDGTTFDSSKATETFEVKNELTFKTGSDTDADKVSAPGVAVATGSDLGGLGKSASDLMSGVAVSSKDTTYTITGTSKYVTDFTKFNETVKDEQSGHYIALVFTKPENAPKDGYIVTVNGASKKEFAADKFFTEDSGKKETLIMRLDAIKDKKFTVAFDWNGDKTADATYTFDCSDLTLAAEGASVTVKPSSGGVSATVDNASDVKDAVKAANKASNKVLTIDVSGDYTYKDVISNSTKVDISFSKDVISALADVDSDVDLAIQTALGTITLDSTALDVITDNNKKTDLVIKSASSSNKPASKYRVSETVYDISFSGVDVTKGTITIALPFEVTDSDVKKDIKKNAQIAYMQQDERSDLASISSVSHLSGDMYRIKAELDHLSYVALVKEDMKAKDWDKSSDDSSDNSNGSGSSSGSFGGGAGSLGAYVSAYDQFTDTKSHWAAEAIRYVVDRALFNGTTTTAFSPEQPMTRAMLATVLFRYAGQPIVQQTTGIFSDVPAGQYYTEAVAWANVRGVVQGLGNSKFNPNGNITRQDLAVMLYRFAGSPIVTGEVTGFADAAAISAYAKDAMLWATQNGILAGDNVKKLNPTATATRAEVATMIMRYNDMGFGS